MKKNILITAAIFSILLVITGCSVTRGQQSVGTYVDDSATTTEIKTIFANSKTVSAGAIGVETLKGVVVLSGFAKNKAEKDAAERLARSVSGVSKVKNNIVIQP